MEPCIHQIFSLSNFIIIVICIWWRIDFFIYHIPQCTNNMTWAEKLEKKNNSILYVNKITMDTLDNCFSFLFLATSLPCHSEKQYTPFHYYHDNLEFIFCNTIPKYSISNLIGLILFKKEFHKRKIWKWITYVFQSFNWFVF